MESSEFARLAHLCVTSGDLSLRSAALEFRDGPGASEAQLPGLPKLRFDCDSPSHPSAHYAQQVRRYVLDWHSLLDQWQKEALEVGSPSVAVANRAKAARFSLDTLSAGQEAFVDGHKDVTAKRQWVNKAAAALQRAWDERDKRVESARAAAHAARQAAEEFGATDAKSVAQGGDVPEHIAGLLRDANRKESLLEEYEGDLLLLRPPLLFGRAAHRSKVDAIRAAQAELNAALSQLDAEIDEACAQFHAQRLADLEARATEAEAAAAELEGPSDEVSTAKDKLAEANAGEVDASERAKREFDALSQQRQALEAAVAEHRRQEQSHEAAKEKVSERFDELRGHLGLAFGGLTAGALSLAMAEGEAASDLPNATAETLCSAGLGKLAVSKAMAEPLDRWLEACPLLMDQFIFVCGNYLQKWMQSDDKPESDASTLTGPMLELVARPGFIETVASSAPFFLAVKDAFMLELFQRQEEPYLVAAVATLLLGDRWCGEHRPDLAGRMKAMASDIVEGVTGRSLQRDPGLQELFKDAEELALRCRSGESGLVPRENLADWSRVMAAIRSEDSPRAAADALKRSPRLQKTYVKRLTGVDSYESARDLLRECGVKLLGSASSSDYTIAVDYLKPGRPQPYSGHIAGAKRTSGGWELEITTPAYFYASGSGTCFVRCATWADWVDYVIMELGTHQRGDGVVLTSRY